MLPVTLLIVNSLFFVLAALFLFESIREKEPRAPKIGLALLAGLLLLALLLIFLPFIRWPIAILFGLLIVFGLLFFIPGKPKPIEGSKGYVVGEVKRFDERDISFARNRSLPPGSDIYRRYYEMHPDREEPDARRRDRGGPVGRIGAIDNFYWPNVSMIGASFSLPPMLGPYAEATPEDSGPSFSIEPEKASEIVKGFTRHLGADLVGLCRVNPLWAYSHRGEIYYDNWGQWGKEIREPLPYAVVFATEMKPETVGSGPHTPALVESSANYAKGAYISTILSRWFAGMGHKAVAQHSRHYDLLMVPLAVDAGLGELGRNGYLISDRLGPRVRIFAVLTDMPLVPDKPVYIGVEEFCRRCKKCATACPSRSISTGDKTIFNGVEKWKLDEDSCFEYWGKAGTDCSICMGVCPFSRPNRSIHRLVRWLLARSPLARRFFPYIDNVIYGKKWKSRPVPPWVDYRHREGESK